MHSHNRHYSVQLSCHVAHLLDQGIDVLQSKHDLRNNFTEMKEFVNPLQKDVCSGSIIWFKQWSLKSFNRPLRPRKPGMQPGIHTGLLTETAAQ